MIVVNIDLWPYGLNAVKKRLGNIIITNDGKSDNVFTGNYDVVFEELQHGSNTEFRSWTIKVQDFDRTQGIFALLKAVMESNTHANLHV